MTHGARALAKHGRRSSSGYWGSLVGNGKNSVLGEYLGISMVISFQFYFRYLSFSSYINLFSVEDLKLKAFQRAYLELFELILGSGYTHRSYHTV